MPWLPSTERDELDGFEPLPGVRDERQRQVTVGVRVAVPGKMLTAGEHAALLKALDERAPVIRATCNGSLPKTSDLR